MASCKCRYDRCKRRSSYKYDSQKQCISIDGSNGATKVNCACTPCEKSVIVEEGDAYEKKLIPILGNVLENCITINRYEMTYPSTLSSGALQTFAIQTNLSNADVAEGDLVCIKCINYSYDCVGPAFNTEGETPVLPNISGMVNGKDITFNGTNLSCSCNTGNPEEIYSIYTEFSTQILTKSCICCDSNSISTEEYVENKIVEMGVSYGACNFNISVSGTIGNKCFTGVFGYFNNTQPNTPGPFARFPQVYVPLVEFEFPATFNFAGTMCLPSNKNIKLEESFDNCLVVECIRPTSSTLVNVAQNPDTDPVAFQIIPELSLIIRKTINAVTTQKLAALSNYDAKVICSEEKDAMPECPGDENNCGCCGVTNCPAPLNN